MDRTTQNWDVAPVISDALFFRQAVADLLQCVQPLVLRFQQFEQRAQGSVHGFEALVLCFE